MTAIAIAIPLTHQSFGAIILAFDKAIREARGQKVKEGQDFLPPVAKGRQGGAQFGGTLAFDGSDPGIQACRRCASRSRRIPAAQPFFELPRPLDLWKGRR